MVVSLGIGGVEGAFIFGGGLCLVANDGLDGGDESARHEEEVVVEDADEVEEGIETRGDLAVFDSGDMDLREADTAAEFELAPTAGVASGDEGEAEVCGEAFGSLGSYV